MLVCLVENIQKVGVFSDLCKLQGLFHMVLIVWLKKKAKFCGPYWKMALSPALAGKR